MLINFSKEELGLLKNYSNEELIEFADTLNNYILGNFGFMNFLKNSAPVLIPAGIGAGIYGAYKLNQKSQANRFNRLPLDQKKAYIQKEQDMTIEGQKFDNWLNGRPLDKDINRNLGVDYDDAMRRVEAGEMIKVRPGDTRIHRNGSFYQDDDMYLSSKTIDFPPSAIRQYNQMKQSGKFTPFKPDPIQDNQYYNPPVRYNYNLGLNTDFVY